MVMLQRTGRATFIYSGVIILLLFSNGFLLWKHAQLKSEVRQKGGQAKARPIEALMTKPFQTSTGETITLEAAKSRYLVLYAFTPLDCAPCLSELTALNRIAEIRNDTKVYGLISHSNLDEAGQTQRNFGVSFPLLQDPEGEILDSLHLPKTPWKIVVSVAKREIIYEDQPSLTEVEREAFLRRLGQLEGR